jgi:hypothetical protein
MPQEEIDLGTLFSQIGKVFSNLFDFLGGLLKELFHYFIHLLLFFRKHALKLGIAAILGAVIGYFVENQTTGTYRYDMIIEPHYDAAYQMSERIQYYNELIFSEDSLRLSKLFNIDYEDANSLIEFEMIRQEDQRDLIEDYDEFIKGKDSLTLKRINFDDFKGETFSSLDAKKFAFRMSLSQERLKRNIQKELIADLENNPHLQAERKATLNRLEIKENNLLKTLRDVDSIRKTYKEVSLLIAKNKTSSVATIDVVDSKRKNDNDIRLFGEYKNAYRHLDTLLVERQTMTDIYKIITPLKPLGKVQSRVIERKTVIFSLLFIGLMLLIILLAELNKYLKNYTIAK